MKEREKIGILLLGVGYTVVKNAFLAVLFLGQFFVFHSTYLNMKRQHFWLWVQEKSVQRPLVILYLFLWWEWIWAKKPLRTSFSGMLLWFYCLIMCKWTQNTKFWNFHENRTFCFCKNLHSGSKSSGRALFTICRKFCFIRYFKVYSCKDNYMCYLLKKFEHFITSSLSLLFKCMGSTHFSYVQFNGGIQMNVLMSTVDKLLMIKCSNFLRRSSLGLSSHLYTLK